MFSENIKKFNSMYKMPIATQPALDQLGKDTAFNRLKSFKKILIEELDEIDTIIEKVEGNSVYPFSYKEIDILTELADLLGDLQVYCASEMVKFGLPIDPILEIIMHSNFSKMGADGKPIFDEMGKLLKGPNYWKPESKIEELLKAYISLSNSTGE